MSVWRWVIAVCAAITILNLALIAAGLALTAHYDAHADAYRGRRAQPHRLPFGCGFCNRLGQR